MGIDSKYGRVTTERGSIGVDEPVMVFRAQDKVSLYVIEAYRQMCVEAGSPQHHIDGINETFLAWRAWQAENFTKVPESA